MTPAAADREPSHVPTVIAGDLATLVPAVTVSSTCAEAREFFDRTPGLLAIAVIDRAGRPIGLINRFRFLERLATRFGRELTLNKGVEQFMDCAPLVLDATTNLDELGSRLLEQQDRFVFDGFIVTRHGRYAGIGTGLDLVRALTERRHAELTRMALHDLLTGLPNRALFEQQLSALLAGARDAREIGVLFIDLDRFKEVNDTFGHRFGDLVLSGIAQRLRGAVRHSDIVARLSGDEFAVVMPGVATQSDVGRIARVLLDSCRAPLVIDGHDIVVSCSIGAAVYPYHGQTQEALLRAADAAQYRAKEARNSWHYFSPDMHDRMTPTPGLAALRRAIEAELLEVHYQPIVDLGSGRISAVEALVRWTHLGVAVPAGAVVLLAEESGLIVALTEFVLRTGLRQMRRWDATTGRTDLRLAVNLSALQVHEGLIESVDAIAGDTGFDLRRLDFELTERAAMRASAQALAVLHGLRARGITLTIDDFGTGYSALSRLERLPIDAMKIDKTFLEQVADHRNGVIARAIIAMGHALGLAVVAEGVETAEQLDFLRRQGCDHAQGFLLSAPAHGEHLHGMLVSGVVVPPASAAV